MKVVFAFVLAVVPAFTSSFIPSVTRKSFSPTSLSAQGAAKSPAEDIELTLKVIMDNLVDDEAGIDDSDDDTPYEAPEPPVAVTVAAPVEPVVDLSVPYDSAAMLAYEASDKSMSFDEFKPKYLEETSAMIAEKQKARSG